MKMYIAIVAILLSGLGWQWFKLMQCDIKVAELEADNAKLQRLAETRQIQIDMHQNAINAQNKQVAEWKQEADEAKAISRELLVELELSQKASQGRIQKVWQWAGDSCESVMPKIRELMGL